jgi:hypothetical protein
MPFTTRDNGGARLGAELDAALDPLVLSLTDHRSDRRAHVMGRADFDFLMAASVWAIAAPAEST